MEWIRAQGLGKPVDLRYAFCSYEEALEAADEEVAKIWLQTQERSEELPRSWEVLAEAVRKPMRKAEAKVKARPAKWKGIGKLRKARVCSDQADEESRRNAACMVVQVAKTWGRSCTLRSDIGDDRQAEIAALCSFLSAATISLRIEIISSLSKPTRDI